MAADTQMAVYHGASPGSASDVSSTTIRFKRADDDAQDTNDPIPIPTSGFNYSWRKAFKLRVDPAGSGPDNGISNVRFFSEGQDLGTDRDILAATASSYTQGSSGDESSAISATNVDTYTTSSPLVVEAGTAFTASETGDGSQDFVVLQARIGPAAVPGNVSNAKGLVYRYDEI